MKVFIYDWGSCEHFLKKAGFKNNQEIPYNELFQTVEKLFNVGLNVMIYRSKADTTAKTIYIFVDTWRFQQR